MNTQPTPETDQWETYCDEFYYHMWRLRRKTERGWHDGFHIHTGDEARGLCDLLNNLERERDEARGQRDRLAEASKSLLRHIKQIRSGDSPLVHPLLIESMDNSAAKLDEALQSLTKPTEP